MSLTYPFVSFLTNLKRISMPTFTVGIVCPLFIARKNPHLFVHVQDKMNDLVHLMDLN
jgi:hypothetical protein